MCAKKTTTTPTKQNTLAGITKTPVKKVAATQKQTTKTSKSEDVVKPNVKINSEVKKLEVKSTATSNKKVVETKPANKSVKKAKSRDNSADNAKGKKQPLPQTPNGKAGKVKTNDSDRDKLGENKSNHIKDNKSSASKNDEAKSKCNEQCNKVEKSSSSMKSNGESDNVIKDKEKNCKKGKVLSPTATPKKSADRTKSSKVVKKTKIKISNELKNLGIEMSKSNSSLAVVIQEGITGGVKTSICEMVKTKARFCSNVKGQSAPAVKAPANKTNKESQEKIETKASNEMKTGVEQIKLIEMAKSEEKKILAEVAKSEAQVNSRNKISALVNAKNKNKSVKSEAATSEIEIKICEDSEAAKTAKRKYVKKKKLEDGVESLKNASNEAIDKRDQNKPNISDDKNLEIKSTQAVSNDKKTHETSLPKSLQTKAKAQLQEPTKGKKVQDDEKSLVDPSPTATEKIKRKYVKKVKASQPEGDDKSKKPQNDDAEKPKLVKNECNQTSEAKKVVNGLQKSVMDVVDAKKSSEADEKKTAVDAVKKSEIKSTVDSKKSLSTDTKKSQEKSPFIAKKSLDVDSKKTSQKPSTDAKNSQDKAITDSKKSSNLDSKKSSEKLVKNSDEPEKVKDSDSKKLDAKKSPAKITSDLKKSPEKPANDVKKSPTKPKVESQEKSNSPKNKAKPNDKHLKLSPKKQKIEIKEEDPLALSSESENSSNSSDSESEEIFKKPNKPIQRNLRHKKQKLFACKRTRVASLNAIAKVHCLYENENRSTMDANILMAIKNSLADHTSGEEDDDDDDENEDEKVDFVSKR